MLRTLCVSVLATLATAQGWVDRTPANPLTGPSSRAFPAMCWDAAHGYVLMFGGAPGSFGGGAVNETWSWNGTSWTRHNASQLPYGGWYQEAPHQTAMVFHPPTNEVVMVHFGTTWTWTGTDWLLRNAPIGAGNDPRDIAMAHDPIRNQTVLFVGTRYAYNQGPPAPVSQTFVWDGFSWSPRSTPVTPWPIQNPAMAFDPVANRLVLATSGSPAGAFYEWTGSNWQQRFPAGAPVTLGAMASDTPHQRIVMLDGVMNAQPNHTWTLANGQLQQVSTAIEPARRFGAAMAYDPIRGKVVMFGGTNQWNYQNLNFALGDTWEFELGAGASYSTFGTGCTGSRGVPTLTAQAGSLPRIGQTFQGNLGNLPFTGPVFLFVGISNTTYGPTPLPFGLGSLGAPGCNVLSSGEDLRLLTNVLGSSLWQWTIPNAPGVSFYNQAFAFDPAANALGLTVSNGGQGTIGY